MVLIKCITSLFLKENPSEEDAAIVDKVLSMRLTKKEVCLFPFSYSYFNAILILFIRILESLKPKTCSSLSVAWGPIHHC